MVKKGLLFGIASLVFVCGSSYAQTLQQVNPSELQDTIASSSGVLLPQNGSGAVTPPVQNASPQSSGPVWGGDVFLHPEDDPLARDSRLSRYFHRIGAQLRLFSRQGHAGLYGYFSRIPATHNGQPVIDQKTGLQVVKTQVIYVIPGDDGEFIEGDLRSSEGEPLTLKKLVEMREGAKSISENLEEILGGGGSAPQSSTSSVPAPAPAEQSSSASPAQQSYTNPLELPQKPNDALQYPQGLKLSDKDVKAVDTVWLKPNINADELLKDVSDHTSHFVVGSNQNAPMIYLIVDPHCEFCHALWYEVRPYVLSGKIRATIILSSLKGGQASLDDAAQILSSHKAGPLWMSGVGNNPAMPVPMITPPSNDRYKAYYKAVETSNNQFLQKYLAQVMPNAPGGVPLSMFVYNGHVYGFVGTFQPIIVSSFIGRLTGADDKGVSETIR